MESVERLCANYTATIDRSSSVDLISLIYLILLTPVTLIANLVLLFILIIHKEFHTPPNAYLAGLSLSGILLSISALISITLSLSSPTTDLLMIEKTRCFLLITPLMFQWLSFTCIIWYRYQVVCRDRNNSSHLLTGLAAPLEVRLHRCRLVTTSLTIVTVITLASGLAIVLTPTACPPPVWSPVSTPTIRVLLPSIYLGTAIILMFCLNRLLHRVASLSRARKPPRRSRVAPYWGLPSNNGNEDTLPDVTIVWGLKAALTSVFAIADGSSSSHLTQARQLQTSLHQQRAFSTRTSGDPTVNHIPPSSAGKCWGEMVNAVDGNEVVKMGERCGRKLINSGGNKERKKRDKVKLATSKPKPVYGAGKMRYNDALVGCTSADCTLGVRALYSSSGGGGDMGDEERLKLDVAVSHQLQFPTRGIPLPLPGAPVSTRLAGKRGKMSDEFTDMLTVTDSSSAEVRGRRRRMWEKRQESLAISSGLLRTVLTSPLMILLYLPCALPYLIMSLVVDGGDDDDVRRGLLATQCLAYLISLIFPCWNVYFNRKLRAMLPRCSLTCYVRGKT